jgi:hypothetical protein
VQKAQESMCLGLYRLRFDAYETYTGTAGTASNFGMVRLVPSGPPPRVLHRWLSWAANHAET